MIPACAVAHLAVLTLVRCRIPRHRPVCVRDPNGNETASCLAFPSSLNCTQILVFRRLRHTREQQAAQASE